MPKQQTISIERVSFFLKNGYRKGVVSRMKDKDYWNQFMQSGKVEDYLKFKNETEEYHSPKGEVVSAGFYDCNRDDHQGSAYRGIR